MQERLWFSCRLWNRIVFSMEVWGHSWSLWRFYAWSFGMTIGNIFYNNSFFKSESSTEELNNAIYSYYLKQLFGRKLGRWLYDQSCSIRYIECSFTACISIAICDPATVKDWTFLFCCWNNRLLLDFSHNMLRVTKIQKMVLLPDCTRHKFCFITNHQNDMVFFLGWRVKWYIPNQNDPFYGLHCNCFTV